MATLLASLGSSTGMSGAGGVTGGQGAQAQAPSVQVGQARYTDPFQTVAPASNAQTPVNTGSASGSVYR